MHNSDLYRTCTLQCEWMPLDCIEFYVYTSTHTSTHMNVKARVRVVVTVSTLTLGCLIGLGLWLCGGHVV